MIVVSPQKIGAKKAVKATLITIGVALFFSLLDETAGDFANGILFFFSAILDGFFLLLLGSLLLLSFWLGRIAGKAILQQQRPFWIIGLGMAVITAFYILSYLAALRYFNTNDDAAGLYSERIRSAITDTIKEMGGRVLLLQSLCWFWIANAIKRTSKKNIAQVK